MQAEYCPSTVSSVQYLPNFYKNFNNSKIILLISSGLPTFPREAESHKNAPYAT